MAVSLAVCFSEIVSFFAHSCRIALVSSLSSLSGLCCSILINSLVFSSLLQFAISSRVMIPSLRQRYCLGHGIYSGQLTLDNGNSVWMEYLKDVERHVTSSLPHLQDALLEYIACRV